MTPLRIGSVCTGYGGLDMAVQQVLGGHLAWVADPDPGAAAILAHHHPEVPNLGDITETDWTTVEPVDVVLGGYPCQPFSVAGLRKGTADERHLWPYIASALGVLRPRLAIFENVQGHLRLGFDTVLADLARLGFDAEWCLVRASEVGAAHRRSRLFIVAWPADAACPGLPWPGVRGRTAERGGTAADAADLGHERLWCPRGRRPGPAHSGVPTADAARSPGSVSVGDRAAAADAASLGRGERRPEPARQQGRPGVAVGRGATATDPDSGGLPGHGELPAGRHTVRVGQRNDADGQRPPAAAHTDGGRQRPLLDELRPGEPDAAWGTFLPAIRRWEHTTGRRAPRATDARNRLSPAFVEWLMGLPAGHVTAVPGLSRTQQLKALGNGVVPQQATAALRLLLDRAAAAA